MLDFFSRLLLVYTSVQYRFSLSIRKQLAKRFPLFYPLDGPGVHISRLIIVGEIAAILMDLRILEQLRKYRKTKHIHQGISKTLLAFLIFCTAFHAFTFTCSALNYPQDRGKFGVYYVEHMNYLWVNAQLFQCFKLIPQVSINWVGNCTRGCSSKFVVLSIISSLIGALSWFFGSYGPMFYLKPWNYTPVVVYLCLIFSSLLLFYQAQYLYVANSPFLSKTSNIIA